MDFEFDLDKNPQTTLPSMLSRVNTIQGVLRMKEDLVKVIAALVLSCAALSACKTPDIPAKRELPHPSALPPESLPTAGVDAALRTVVKSYVGLSLDQEGAVRLALAETDFVPADEPYATKP